LKKCCTGGLTSTIGILGLVFEIDQVFWWLPILVYEICSFLLLEIFWQRGEGGRATTKQTAA
jgi:hypothetical protein